MARQLEDDGFHEIQLNGKQLVFLFMAATVVSVVIFLCGVLVGRGVRTERIQAEAVTLPDTRLAEVRPPSPPPPSAPVDSDPTAVAPPPTVDDLSYYKRLGQDNAPVEEVKPLRAKPAQSVPEKAEKTDKPVKAEKPEKAAKAEKAPAVPAKASIAPVKDPPPTAVKDAAPTVSEPVQPPSPPAPAAAAAAPGGSGYVVQIAALNVRSEADAIASRLVSKGYTAFVVSPSNGTAQVFRVRVGTFKTRREAESIAAKLQREEQFKPWVTR